MNRDRKLITLLVDILTSAARNVDDFGREISTLKEVAEVINERKMISERVTSNSIKQAKYRLKKLGVLEDFLPDFEIFEKNDDFLLPNYRQPL